MTMWIRWRHQRIAISCFRMENCIQKYLLSICRQQIRWRKERRERVRDFVHLSMTNACVSQLTNIIMNSVLISTLHHAHQPHIFFSSFLSNHILEIMSILLQIKYRKKLPRVTFAIVDYTHSNNANTRKKKNMCMVCTIPSEKCMLRETIFGMCICVCWGVCVCVQIIRYYTRYGIIPSKKNNVFRQSAFSCVQPSNKNKHRHIRILRCLCWNSAQYMRVWLQVI